MTDFDLSPAFVRLARHIRERIVRGEWLPGQLMPGEEVLAKQLQVSVGTVRKAFDVLSGQGLVTRHRGRGTFVARATHERAFTSFYRLVDRDDGMRRIPTDTILLRERATAEAAECAALRLPANALVYRLRRRRALDGVPLVLETIAFPYERVGGKEWGEDGAAAHLVYSFLEQQCGVSVSRVEDRLQAALLPEELSAEFGIAPGEPVLLAIRVAFDLNGAPVEYRRSWMVTAGHDYLCELRWAGTASSPR
ncbi:GntR family transcriptional regulator [Cupriavidus necator]|uniref:GntR family transcriptional regulator n=1 Tax=Cupriavidus necator TaxID=106590 RepID=UPI00278647AC|nr:GntR family transcriptional regulator [Cupriavidus necator]MDQ0138463.1 GntR family transcriptional regulator [Cupriavidus necator]